MCAQSAFLSIRIFPVECFSPTGFANSPVLNGRHKYFKRERERERERARESFFSRFAELHLEISNEKEIGEAVSQ